MIGWIKLHRQILEWEWSDCPKTFCLFIHLLLKANFEPSKYHGYEIPVGSLVFGRKAFSSSTGLSEQKIRTSLNRLEKSNEVTIKITNKFSIISMVNWKKYQLDNLQVTNNQPTTNQQLTTLKEDNNIIKKESIILGVVTPKQKNTKGNRLEKYLKDSFGKQDTPQEWGDWAYKEMFIPIERINLEWETFIDYWKSVAGQKGVKLDWKATWRNWIRKVNKDIKRKDELNELYAKKY